MATAAAAEIATGSDSSMQGSPLLRSASGPRHRITPGKLRHPPARAASVPVESLIVSDGQKNDAVESIVKAAAETSENQEMMEILEGMLKSERRRDPNWGKCDESCIEDGQIAQTGTKTYTCHRHGRVHICDPIEGDDHPLVLITPAGLKTCLFSNNVVGKVMLTQEYNARDKTSRRIIPNLAGCLNRVVAEWETNTPYNTRNIGATRRRKRPYVESHPVDPDNDDDGMCNDCPTAFDDEMFDDGASELAKGLKAEDDADGPAVDIVRERVSNVFDLLCHPAKRRKIQLEHARTASKEMVKRISAYERKCKRGAVRPVVQEEEDIVIEVMQKHKRTVPVVTPAQRELWVELVVLFWRHFGPYRKKARSGGNATKGSLAGAVPFSVGGFNLLAEGMVSNSVTILEKSHALAAVMPRAVDFEALGIKQHIKSSGRKMLARAIQESAGKTAMDDFIRDKKVLYEYLREKYTEM